MANRNSVLIVEDEYLVAALLAEWVLGAGYTVVGPAAGPEQAQALINEQGHRCGSARRAGRRSPLFSACSPSAGYACALCVCDRVRPAPVRHRVPECPLALQAVVPGSGHANVALPASPNYPNALITVGTVGNIQGLRVPVARFEPGPIVMYRGLAHRARLKGQWHRKRAPCYHLR